MQTDTQKSNSLTTATSGLERLLNLAIGGYQAVTQAKLEKQLAQQSIQQNQTTPNQSVPPAGVDQRTLLIAGGAVAAAVLLVVLLKK